MAVLWYQLNHYKTVHLTHFYGLLLARFTADCEMRVCIIDTHELSMTNQYTNVLIESV